MVCSNCKMKLREGALFCTYCGTKVEVEVEPTCPKCQAKLKQGAAFCHVCGAALNASSLETSQPIKEPQENKKGKIVYESTATRKAWTCEMCGSNDLIKQDGLFACAHCGTKYTVEEARRMMVEGTLDIQGTVKVDNSAFVEKYLANARRAMNKEDWEEVEKYYNLVEQNAPYNIEAVFFSSYGRVMLALFDTEYFKREQKFNVLKKSISVIDDYYEVTNEPKEEVLKSISDALIKMYSANFIRQRNQAVGAGSLSWQNALFKMINDAFLSELQSIASKHDEPFIKELIAKHTSTNTKGSCYIATAVYGSYDCPQVWTLRRYRDYTLAETWYGRAFIHIYYAISPTLVKWFGHTDLFKKAWRSYLDNIVQMLQSKGIESTPYEDRSW